MYLYHVEVKTQLKLKNLAESVYTVLKGDSTCIYKEYEKIPVTEHEQVYAVVGIEKMIFESGFLGESGKYFSGKYNVKIKVLSDTNNELDCLYDQLDQILDRLEYGGFSVKHIEIMQPFFDNGLRRFIVECNLIMGGKSEVLNELQS